MYVSDSNVLAKATAATATIGRWANVDANPTEIEQVCLLHKSNLTRT